MRVAMKSHRHAGAVVRWTPIGYVIVVAVPTTCGRLIDGNEVDPIAQQPQVLMCGRRSDAAPDLLPSAPCYQKLSVRFMSPPPVFHCGGEAIRRARVTFVTVSEQSVHLTVQSVLRTMHRNDPWNYLQAGFRDGMFPF